MATPISQPNYQSYDVFKVFVRCTAMTVLFFFFSLAEANEPRRWQVKDVIQGATVPFAIGHRGFGANLGEDRGRPIENTIFAVRKAFYSNASIAEIDVQLTQDGHAVVFHNNKLADGTCINTLSLQQLRLSANQIPTLKRVLEVAGRFSYQQQGPVGILDIEISPVAANCPTDELLESDLVKAVVSDIEHADMVKQVLIESLSPTILGLVADSAPDVARVLSVNSLQFLTLEQLETTSSWEVSEIEKDEGFGLQWVNSSEQLLLPSYDSIEQFTRTALALDSTAVNVDIEVLQQAELSSPGSANLVVSDLKFFGLMVWGFAADQADWALLRGLGVEGIVVDDVRLGVVLQSSNKQLR